MMTTKTTWSCQWWRCVDDHKRWSWRVHRPPVTQFELNWTIKKDRRQFQVLVSTKFGQTKQRVSCSSAPPPAPPASPISPSKPAAASSTSPWFYNPGMFRDNFSSLLGSAKCWYKLIKTVHFGQLGLSGMHLYMFYMTVVGWVAASGDKGMVRVLISNTSSIGYF